MNFSDFNVNLTIKNEHESEKLDQLIDIVQDLAAQVAQILAFVTPSHKVAKIPMTFSKPRPRSPQALSKKKK